MVSCCLIVKNEIKVLERCVKSVQEKLSGIVNDIVVVDTGSTDGTRELAVELGCNVFDFEWCDDFAKARNCSIEKAKNDWIMILDADEFIDYVDKKELKWFIKNSSINTILDIDIENIENDGTFISKETVVRLFNKRAFEFRVRIHERLKAKNDGVVYKDKLKCKILHTGYSKETIVSKNKLKRNEALMEAELQENMVHDLSVRLIDSYIDFGDTEKAIAEFERFLMDKDSPTKGYYLQTAKKFLKFLLDNKMYSKAVECEKLWEYCKSDDEYVYNMAVAYSEVKDNEKALECYLACVNWKGDTIIPKKHSYYPVGMVFELVGDLEQALLCYKLSEDVANAQEKVKEIESKLNR